MWPWDFVEYIHVETRILIYRIPLYCLIELHVLLTDELILRI
jgi:hypothetical protein